MNTWLKNRWLQRAAFLSVLISCVFAVGLNHAEWISQMDTKVLEFWKAIATVLVALIAAVIASIIQWRQAQTAHKQWETARNKLRFDLFGKRFDLYTKINEILRLADPTIFDDNQFLVYSELQRQAEWLFDDDITEVLESISTYLADLTLGKNNQHVRQQIRAHQKELSHRMKKYLRFHD